MKKLILITALLIAAPAYADKDRGGGYVTYYSRKLLERGAAELRVRVRYTELNHFRENESHRQIFLKALSNIELRPNEPRARNGDELFMDYDVKSGTIAVLKPYFDRFAITDLSERDVLMTAAVLAHEAAHLIGIGDDEAAERFAKNLMSSYINMPFLLGDVRTENSYCKAFSALANGEIESAAVNEYYKKVEAKFCSNGVLNITYDESDDARLNEFLFAHFNFRRDVNESLTFVMKEALEYLERNLSWWDDFRKQNR